MPQHELYFISGSPPCWTVMLAMAVKGLDYEPKRLDNVKRDQKNPAFVAINPRGNVPVLTHGDVVVCQTLAILAYIDATTPSPSFFGTSPVETARIWQAIGDCDGHLRERVGNISRPLFRGKAADVAEEITGAMSPVRDEMARLDTALSTQDYLVGDTISAADLIVYPVVQQLLRAAAREDARQLDLGVYPLGDHYVHLDTWAHRIEALPGYDDAYPPHWK
jgi:glutathione S-transferase